MARFWREGPGRAPLVVVFGFALLLAVSPGGAQSDRGATPEPGQVVATAVHPLVLEGPKETAHRVPLVELYTATWCPPCAPADRALDRLLDEMSPGLAASNGSMNASAAIDLALLAYHPVPDPGGEDPFGVPEAANRLELKYGAFWFPSVYVDGVFEDAPENRGTTVDAGMEEVAYNGYKNLIKRAKAIEPSFVITTEATPHDDGNWTLDVTLTATGPVEGPIYLRGALWEDHIRFPGTNGVEDHRMTVRALLDRVIDADGVARSESWTAQYEFVVPEDVVWQNAGVTVFVETAWDEPPRDASGTLMALAGGIGIVASTLVFMMTRRTKRSRMDPTGADR